MPMAAMARREQELGYPPSHPLPPSGGVGFTLPSINDIGVPRPLGLGPNELGSSSSSGSLPKLRDGREMISPKSVETNNHKRRASELLNSDKDTRNEQAETSSLPVDPPTPTPPRPPSPSPRLFSTWLPDDSLPFIQPQLLSEAEKETLDRRRSESKSSLTPMIPVPDPLTGPLPSPTPSPLAQATGPSPGSDPELSPGPVSRSQPHPGSPREPQNPTLSPYTDSLSMIRHLPRPKSLEVPPSHPASHTRTPGLGPAPLIHISPLAPTSLRRPLQLRRAHTTDLELLRQVKSNNLTLPTSASSSASGSGTTMEMDRESARYQSSPFTRVPLAYPRLQSVHDQRQPQHQHRRQHHIPVHQRTDPRDPRNPAHSPSTKLFPPTSSNSTQKITRTYPSTLEPVSPRSMYPSSEIRGGTHGGISHSWPRSDSRHLSEEGRGGHPYSREMGVGRVRGGHGFRHQR